MQSAHVWNKGAWFGSQLGCSAWALLLGFSLLVEDIPAALVCLVACVAFNAYGLHLWRSRDRMSAYAGMLRLQCAFLALFLIAIVVVQVRGVSPSQTPRDATEIRAAYGWLAVPLIFMLWSYLRERAARRTAA